MAAEQHPSLVDDPARRLEEMREALDQAAIVAANRSGEVGALV